MNQPAPKNKFLFLVILAFLAVSCYEYTPTPRPFTFPRINLPENVTYSVLDTPACPVYLEYPAFGVISRSMADSCWTDISFPEFNCKWHVTYRNATETGKKRSKHFEEYRGLVYKHSQKATEIRENPVTTPAGSGVFFEMYGNVGTPAQLFLSDSTGEHILMLSMYYMTAEKNDSLAPVSAFMKTQIQHLANSVKWEN